MLTVKRFSFSVLMAQLLIDERTASRANANGLRQAGPAESLEWQSVCSPQSHMDTTPGTMVTVHNKDGDGYNQANC